MSLLIIALSALAYAVTILTTRGESPGDWVTAFLAGVAGKLVIEWTALPIYRSVRVRGSAATNAA